MNTGAVGHQVSFGEATRVWLKIGFLSFGGPAGQIALMHKLIVDEKRWIGEERFLHALNYCTLLPGPEAQQLATYIGWLLHGTRGGLVAGTLFVVPGALAILALSIIYVTLGHVPLIDRDISGAQSGGDGAGRRSGVARRSSGVCAATIARAVAADRVSRAVRVRVAVSARRGRCGCCSASSGLAAGRAGFGAGSHGGAAADAPIPVIDDAALHRAPPGAGRALRMLAIWLPLWFLPMALSALLLGPQHLYVQSGMFFAGMAVVTFGGAYAVLAYVAQRAVVDFGWLTSAQMLDGLALAETTPGPLILVVQFVAFVAGYQAHGMAGGVIAAIIALWVTFVPCFLWIFPRRAVRGVAAASEAARRRARRDHRRRRRRDSESRAVVRAACAVHDGVRGASARHSIARARSCEPRCSACRVDGTVDVAHVRAALVDDANAARDGGDRCRREHADRLSLSTHRARMSARPS